LKHKQKHGFYSFAEKTYSNSPVAVAVFFFSWKEKPLGKRKAI